MDGHRATFVVALIAAMVAPEGGSRAKPPRAQRRVAVLELQNEAELTVFEIERLADDLRGVALEQTGPLGYIVITRESMLELLPTGRDLITCNGAQCEVEAGRMVGADLVVSGGVGWFSKKLVLGIKLFDTRTAALLSQMSVEAKDLLGLRSELQMTAPTLFVPVGGGDGARPAPGSVSGPRGPSITSGKVTEAFGFLTVTSRPNKGARLELTDSSGGRVASGSPYVRRQAALGQWSVRATAPGYEDAEQSFEVTPDETTLVEVALRALGALVLDGEPRGASVQVKGPRGFASEGGLPWEARGVVAGVYSVEVSRKGYVTETREVVVQPGEETRERVGLVRETDDVRGARIEWVELSGGSFDMGASDGQQDEAPVHVVELSAFAMARTETTVRQYEQCVAVGACTMPDSAGPAMSYGKPDRRSHPVNGVTWDDADAFCHWAGGYLPSEAQWEFAARSGGKAIPWPWGSARATCERAVMNGDDGLGPGCGRKTTWPVCSKPLGGTAQGLCDMGGNVAEWVLDWYGRGAYATAARQEPSGPDAGRERVIRGGGFDYSGGLRTSYRDSADPEAGSAAVGFRCAKSPKVGVEKLR